MSTTIVTIDTITDNQIRTLRGEADMAGDVRMAVICMQAIGGPEALEDAEGGSEADMLASEGRSQRWCRERCVAAINAARTAAVRS